MMLNAILMDGTFPFHFHLINGWREKELRAEEAKATEARAKAEADRLNALQQEAKKREEAEARSREEAEAARLDAEEQIKREREEDEKRREGEKSVNLDSSHEALMMMEDMS